MTVRRDSRTRNPLPGGSSKAAPTSMIAQCARCGATATSTGVGRNRGVTSIRTFKGVHEGCGGQVRVYRNGGC